MGTEVHDRIMNIKYVVGRGPKMTNLDEYIDLVIADVSTDLASTDPNGAVRPEPAEQFLDAPPEEQANTGPEIPRYLIVLGVFGAFIVVAAAWAYRRRAKSSSDR